MSPEKGCRKQRGQPATDTHCLKKVFDGPDQSYAGTADGPGFYMFKATEQPAVAAECKSCKVVGLHMNLLHEWRIGVNDTARLQHAMDFSRHTVRFQDVLKHGLYPNAVKGQIGKGQPMPITCQHSIWRSLDIRSQDMDIRTLAKRFCTGTYRSPADHQDSWSR